MLKFELSLDETNLILSALGKAPYESVAGLINKFQQQARPQLPALEEAAKAEASKAEQV